MLKLLGSLLVASLCQGCHAQPRHAQFAETPDPIVGDLHCARSRISILEALYQEPDAPPMSNQCDAH
jgi:hypothetical protein